MAARQNVYMNRERKSESNKRNKNEVHYNIKLHSNIDRRTVKIP